MSFPESVKACFFGLLVLGGLIWAFWAFDVGVLDGCFVYLGVYFEVFCLFGHIRFR